MIDIEPPRAGSAQPKRRTIVIVDDSNLVRAATSRVLERAGYATIALATPIGFSAVLRDRRPDLALVDVDMPALRGDQLVAIATRRGGGALCQIVLFSDRSSAELEVLARDCGAAGYVCKSSDWASVLRSIERFLPA